MALIPNDIGIRMRLETEAQLLQPVRPIAGIPFDALNLRVGERFTARIQEVLPENTYKALVAGKSLTLSLPNSAKAGDTLELVVVDRSQKAILAHTALSSGTENKKVDYPFTTLSRAGQLIGTLLPAEGETAAPVSLNRGQALLAQAPLAGNSVASSLAPVLADAIKRSGVFYESQQAQWAGGRLPLEQLLKNPQAQRSNLALLMSANSLTESLEGFAGSPQESALVGRRDASPNPQPSLLQMFWGNDADGGPKPIAAGTAGIAGSDARSSLINGGAGSTGNAGNAAVNTTAATTAADAASGIPDDLKPIIQQQLEALATQRLSWHGEVWPNQHMQWEIDWQHHPGTKGEQDETMWGTTLSLTTPRLGELHARLQLAQGGVRVIIATPTGATAADLRQASPLLEQALEAAGVPLRGFSVKHASDSVRHLEGIDRIDSSDGDGIGDAKEIP